MPRRLEKLRESGLTAEARDGRLVVRPRERLTDELRAYIREHKPEILAELQGRDAGTRPGAIEPGTGEPDPLQAEALQMLGRDPDLRYGIATDTDGDPVRVAVAIRNVATVTLLVPADKWDAFAFMEVLNQQQGVN